MATQITNTNNDSNSSNTSKNNRIEYFTYIPDDIIGVIFGFLDTNFTRGQCFLVCKLWQDMIMRTYQHLDFSRNIKSLYLLFRQVPPDALKVTTSLDLSFSSLTESAINQILSKLPNLQRLSFEGSNYNWVDIRKLCPNLTALNMRRSRALSVPPTIRELRIDTMNYNLNKVKSFSDNIEVLKISSSGINLDEFHPAKLKKLHCTTAPHDIIASLGNCSTLTALASTNTSSDEIPYHTLKAVNWPNLTALRIWVPPLTTKYILEVFTQLQKLSIKLYDPTQNKEIWEEILTKMPKNLISLKLASNEHANKPLRDSILSRQENLRSLKVDEESRVSGNRDPGMPIDTKLLPKIEKINVNCCLHFSAPLLHLTDLRVTSCRTEDLPLLGKCSQLKILQISNMRSYEPPKPLKKEDFLPLLKLSKIEIFVFRTYTFALDSEVLAQIPDKYRSIKVLELFLSRDAQITGNDLLNLIQNCKSLKAIRGLLQAVPHADQRKFDSLEYSNMLGNMTRQALY